MGTTSTQLHRARLICALYCSFQLLHCAAPATDSVASSAVSDTENGATSQSETAPDATSADPTTPISDSAETQLEPAPTLGEVWVTVGLCGEPEHAVRRASEDALFRPIANCDEVPDVDGLVDPEEAKVCTDSSQCQDEPHGLCMVREAKFCVYASLPETECAKNADCDATPSGTCEFRGCGDPVGRCLYRQSCQKDIECRRAGPGFCQAFIESPGVCSYPRCTQDADCVPGERCGCGSCVPASCMSDADCLGPCRLSTFNCNFPEFFACQDDPAACLSADSGEDCLCQSRNEEWACYAPNCGGPR